MVCISLLQKQNNNLPMMTMGNRTNDRQAGRQQSGSLGIVNQKIPNNQALHIPKLAGRVQRKTETRSLEK